MTTRYNALVDERIQLINEGHELFAATEEDDGRDLTDAEKARDDELQSRLNAVNTELERHERQREREETREAASVIKGNIVANAVKGIEAWQLPTPFSAGGKPWQLALGEQLQAVARSYQNPATAPDQRLMEIQAATGASEAVGSEGGFLVQQDLITEIMRLTHETGQLPRRCDNTPVSANSNGLKINAIDEVSRVDGSRYGGVQAFWAGEASTLTKSKPTFRRVELELSKLTGLYYSTDELLMDASALGTEISREFSEEFGFKLDDAIIRGTGAGMPLGIVGHAGSVSVAKETGQAKETILKENVENMFSRLFARSIPISEWFINQDCWPQLFRLSAAVGTGGVPVYIPPGGLAAAPNGALMGRPVTPLEQCDTVGTKGDIILADFRGYKTIDKGGMEAATSMHVQFLTDEMTFRFIFRFDGQPKRNAPLTPFKGTLTQSAFVTLDNRA